MYSDFKTLKEVSEFCIIYTKDSAPMKLQKNKNPPCFTV